MAAAPVDGRRPVARGSARIACRRQRIVLDSDELGGVFGPVAAVRDDHRHGLADMTDFVGGQHVGSDFVARRRFGEVFGDAILGQDIPQIVDRIDRNDTRRRTRRRDIDGQQPCMGVSAADKGGVKHPVQPDIVDKGRPAGQQVVILNPADGRADQIVRHDERFRRVRRRSSQRDWRHPPWCRG